MATFATVTFQSLLRQVKALRHGQHTDPTAAEYPAVCAFLDASLAEAWRAEWWPDLMRCERRYFRANWVSGTSYTATTEVYDAASQDYYQCLQATSSEAPTTGGVENSAYWALCRAAYSGGDWATATAYAVGDIVHYLVDNNYYQCHTAHTSSAVLVPTATGASARWGRLTEFEKYVDLDATGQTAMGDVFDCKDGNPRASTYWESLNWFTAQDRVYTTSDVDCMYVEFRIVRPNLSGAAFVSGTSYTSGEQVYYSTDLYLCTANTAGTELPTDTGHWSIVEIPKMFEHYLVWAGLAKWLMGTREDARMANALALAESYLRIETDNLYRQQGQTPRLAPNTY